MPRRTAWRTIPTAGPQCRSAIEVFQALERYTKGDYVNAEPRAEDQRLRATYGDRYPRLVKLKNKVDPTK